MKEHKLVLRAICVIVSVAAAVTAIIIFRNEIAEFFVDVRARFDERKLQHKGEFADYADM